MLPTHTSASELLNTIGSSSCDQSDDVSSVSPSIFTATEDNCDRNDATVAGETTTAASPSKVAASTTITVSRSDGSGFIARRPVALALEPINTNATVAGAETDGAAPDRSCIDGNSGNNRARDVNQKTINIAFNNIAYTVKTGIWHRGMCLIYCLFALCWIYVVKDSIWLVNMSKETGM